MYYVRPTFPYAATGPSTEEVKLIRFLDDWSKDHEPLSMVARVLNPNLIRSSSPGALKTREGVKIKILPGFPKTNYLLLVLVQF